MAPSLRHRLFAKQPQEEEASVSTTLTSRTPFYRRKPLSSSTILKPRPSFLSRVLTKVVPCVSVPHSVTPTPLQVLPPPLAQINVEPDEESPALLAGFIIPPHPPPSPADSEVVVPLPINATLLPEDETDGMTSGAVQPPGSLGTDVHTHTHDSDDSDRTDDDDAFLTHLHDEQDEEERLISAGGSGIPIGPVRPCFFPLPPLTQPRTAFPNPFCPRLPLSM